MAKTSDPLQLMGEFAAGLDDVTVGISCTQTSYKRGKSSFFFAGPGAKGIGCKAMFKLRESLEEARELSERDPEQFAAGKTGWVTIRFSADKPPAKRLWQKWLREAHAPG